MSSGRGGLIEERLAKRRRRPRLPRPDDCDLSLTTCPVCTCDGARNGDSHSNDNDADADAKNSATTTAMRTTRPGCASRWWRWRRCQWWGGSAMATGGCCVGNSTPGGCCDGGISTTGCAASARYNLLPCQPEWPGIPPPPGAEGWGWRDMVRGRDAVEGGNVLAPNPKKR